MRVLYIHLSGQLGGAPRSLMELIAGFEPNAVTATVLAPAGPVIAEFDRAGIECRSIPNLSLFDNTRYSYYRGWRWLILVRELLRMPQTCIALWRHRESIRSADVVHMNEILLLVPTVLIAAFLRRPIVVHVRAVQRTQHGWRRNLVHYVLRKYASAVIAIDATVRRSLSADLDVSIIHNGIRLLPSELSSRLSSSPDSLTVGMVGNINLAKGCMEFLQAAILCRDMSIAAKFVFIGARSPSKPSLLKRALKRIGIYQEADADIRSLIEEHGLGGRVEVRPYSADLAAIYRSIDVVCFPSHLDAPGRPIFEAASFGVPSIAAISNPTPDTFLPDETGIKIDPGVPRQLADAVAFFWRDPEARRRMGENARKLAEANFDARVNAGRVLRLYKTVADGGDAGEMLE